MRTPLADAITRAADDLEGAAGQRLVVILGDGRESCGGDPMGAVERPVSQGVDVRLNLVGLALEDRKLRRAMQRLATIGNGEYFDARNPAQLRSAMQLALSAAFEVLDASGQVVASGTLGEVPSNSTLAATTSSCASSPRCDSTASWSAKVARWS